MILRYDGHEWKPKPLQSPTVRSFNLFAAGILFLETLRIHNAWWYFFTSVLFAGNLALSFKSAK